MNMNNTITVTILRHTPKYSLIKYLSNRFDTCSKVGYISKVDTPKGDTIDIPLGFTVQSKQDIDGNTLMSESGQPLSFLSW